MRILILGAGALGGYFGARLLAAGRDVTFLVRPARAQNLATHGLHLLSPERGDLHLPPPPTITTATAPYDLILLSAKAYDLASAIDAIAPAVGPATLILPLLNGMAHMAALDTRFGPAHVLGGTSFISAALAPDGSIHHFNAHDTLFFGHRQGSPIPAITAALTGANFRGEHRPNITQDMWDKWSFLATLAGITCLLRASIGQIASAGATPLALALFAECRSVVTAEEYPQSEEFITLNNGFLSNPASPLRASMLRDLEAGNPIESHQIVGDLLARAQAHQLATPILAIAHAHLKAYEAGRATP